MDRTYLLTVNHVAQFENNIFILPSLPADKLLFDEEEKVIIVKSDGQEIELNAEFSIPLTNPSSYEWWVLILDTQKDQIPIGSEIWINKSLEEITR